MIELGLSEFLGDSVGLSEKEHSFPRLPSCSVLKRACRFRPTRRDSLLTRHLLRLHQPCACSVQLLLPLICNQRHSRHDPLHAIPPLDTTTSRNQTLLMRYIIECGEWRLLQALGALVSQRKSRFVPGSVKANSPSRPDCPSLAEGLLEFELRRIFLLNDFSRTLSDAEFEECDMRLRTLCKLLDKLVDPRLVKGIGPDYPCLRAVVELLQDSDETYDLSSSSNPSLFKPPDDEDELKRALALVTEHNDFLARVLSPSSTREPTTRPVPKRDSKRTRKTWKDSALRDRATATLRALFDHLRCGRNHEIILKLSDPDTGTIPRELNLMLSTCPNQCGWLEVQCGSIESYVRSPSCHY